MQISAERGKTRTGAAIESLIEAKFASLEQISRDVPINLRYLVAREGSVSCWSAVRDAIKQKFGSFYTLSPAFRYEHAQSGNAGCLSLGVCVCVLSAGLSRKLYARPSSPESHSWKAS